MDDFLLYSLIGCLIVFIMVALSHGAPGCDGDCEQGRKACNCRD